MLAILRANRGEKKTELSNSVLWNGITKINLLLDISIARLSQAKCESSILSNIYICVCVCVYVYSYRLIYQRFKNLKSVT